MARDLTVKLQQDKPGSFARVADALGKAGVNIEGITEVEGIVHVLVEDVAGARKALEAAGLKVEADHEVLVLTVPDRPGELARITRKIADASVNLTVVYMASNTRVVVGVDDVAKARQALAVATTA
jgi:hypothetical protein